MMVCMDALTRYINANILDLTKGLRYIVKTDAPSTFQDVCNEASLVTWNGQSDRTIYQDASVNYAFRALHDMYHLETGLGFNPIHEMELGRIQAAKVHAQTGSSVLADVIYIEVSGQAEYYLRNGLFVIDQVQFFKTNMGAY